MHGIRAKMSTASPEIWDLPVRIMHWTLAGSVAGAFVTNRLGVSYFDWHVRCGYLVLATVVLRVVWGFAGSHHALFRSFVRGPAEIAAYAGALLRGRHRGYAGHNPLGAIMVLALLASLALQVAAGLFGRDDIFNEGPLSFYVSEDFSRFLTSIHRRLFWGIAAAIGLHIAAVLLHSFAFKEKLISAMFTGRKDGRAGMGTLVPLFPSESGPAQASSLIRGAKHVRNT